MRVKFIDKIKSWFQSRKRLPLGAVIAICVFPVFIIGVFYVLRPFRPVMDWFSVSVALPVRRFFGMLSSIYPFAIFEVLATIAVIFLIYYIIASFVAMSRKRGKWKILGKRFLPVFVVILYVWGAFSWLWNSGYHATGFAERYGLTANGISVEALTEVTWHFADRSNELSYVVERDEYGDIILDRSEMFAQSTGIFRNISEEFPSLRGRLYPPKSMIYSWLMSITGYAGMYFALTGEAMINTQAPAVFMPTTVAHEHAHQLGVFAEDEATFVGIIASIYSDIPEFQYSGYMTGLNQLLAALVIADPSAWAEVIDSLSDYVTRDRHESFNFWATRTVSDIGIDFIDNILTAIMQTTRDAVDAIYDGYLRAQNQELGIMSYGASVDLLVQYFGSQ